MCDWPWLQKIGIGTEWGKIEPKQELGRPNGQAHRTGPKVELALHNIGFGR